MMPELTRPTVITAAADEDCIRAVTPVPKSQPAYLFPVTFPSVFSSFPPASYVRQELNVFMP
jgi:hypothetical protein